VLQNNVIKVVSEESEQTESGGWSDDENNL